ncbi:MAG: hypothetical protein KDC92_17605 [Bacteroidetes bacterium]|nr:hypothetical protein [Bacteroidota bacterium]
MALLRTLVFVLIGYYVWKIVDAALFSGNKRSREPNGHSTGATKVKYNTADKSHIPDSEGDYIDYQEIK